MAPRDVYVYSAIPPNARRLVRKHGLLAAYRVVEDPILLKKARPNKKDRELFIQKVEDVLASDRPYSVLGPSVFFTPPDPQKITEEHFIKKWKLETIRINLSALKRAQRNTTIWGAELLPIPANSYELSDEQFVAYVKQLGFKTEAAFSAARSRPLTLNEVREFTKASPEALWEHYDVERYAGRFYAANVPHAFIITADGSIPAEFIEF